MNRLTPIMHRTTTGALAGVSYWTAFYPADTVKSYMQTNPQLLRKGFLTTLKDIYRQEGIRGLYRGWGITAVRAAPAHALIFATYEYTIKLLRPELNNDISNSYDILESVRD